MRVMSQVAAVIAIACCANHAPAQPKATPVVDHVSERRCVQEANELARAEFWINEPRRDLRM